MGDGLRRARIGVAVAYLLYGAAVGTWASRIPAIKADVGLGEGELGTALLGMAAGTLVGARLGGAPVDRFGSGPVTRAVTPLVCVSLVGPALAGDLGGLFAALTLFGLLSGLLDVAVNAQGVAVERGYGRPILSGLHGLWSLGGLVGAGGGALAAGAGAEPLVHFAAAAAVLAGVGILGVARLAADRHPVGSRAVRPRWGAWPLPVVLLGVVGFSAYFAEGAVIDWGAVYLRERASASAPAAAAGFAVFALAMTAGRLVGDRVVARFSGPPIVRAGGVLAGAGFALALAVPRPAVAIAALALVGAGLAVVVPLVFSAAGNADLGSTGAGLGRVVTMSYTGSILGPVAIGWLAEEFGLRAALCAPAALAGIVVLLAERVGSAPGRRPR